MTFWYYDIMMGLPEEAERSQAQRFEKRFMLYWIAFTHCPYAIALPYSRGGRSVAQHNYYQPNIMWGWFWASQQATDPDLRWPRRDARSANNFNTTGLRTRIPIPPQLNRDLRDFNTQQTIESRFKASQRSATQHHSPRKSSGEHQLEKHDH